MTSAAIPQACMRADRRSARAQHGLTERDALRQEWWNSKAEVTRGIEGAARFADGKGRSGRLRGRMSRSLEPRYDQAVMAEE